MKMMVILFRLKKVTFNKIFQISYSTGMLNL